MSACPNPNDQAWKDLVIALSSEADAMTAFVRNGNEVPTIEKAKEILDNLRVQDKDEQLSLASDQFKLSRAVQQRQTLETMKFRANKNQKATVQKLIDMNDAYQDFLRNNIEAAKNGTAVEQTLSVSKFIGSSEFKGDPKEYEAFKLFGTFMHELLEFAQEEAIAKNKTIAQIYSQEFFDKVYDNYTKKNPFDIDKLSKDEMYEMALGLVAHVNSKNASGYIILPEVTIVGTSRSGSKVIGRLDILMIDAVGKVHIYDFKTKKVKYLVERNPITGVEEANVDRALYGLALKEFPIGNKPGTAEKFRELPVRTTYDTWMLQLDVYENILKQSDIPVANKIISALMYQIDDDNKSYKGSVLHVFEDQDYYDQARSVNMNTDGQWFNDLDTVNRVIVDFKKAVAIEVPTGEFTEEEIKNKKTEELFDVNPTDKNMEDFIKVLESVIDGQIAKAYDEIQEAQSKNIRDKDLEKLLKTRKDTLNNLKQIAEKLKNTPPSVVLNSVNFFNALNVMESDLETLSEISSVATQTYLGTQNAKEQQRTFNNVREAFNKSVVLTTIIDFMNEVVNEAASNEGSEITVDSPVRQRLAQLSIYAESIQSDFKRLGTDNAIKVLMSPGEKVFSAVNEQKRQALIPELENLKQQLEMLKSNPKLGIYKRLKYSVFTLMNKNFREKVKEAMGPNGDMVLAEIQKVEKRIMQIEMLLKGFEFTEEAMEKYINGITDHTSPFYPGMQNPYEGSDTILGGWMMDSAIASASNSDLAVSAFTTLLKEHKAQAEYNVLTDPQLQKFDKLRQSLLSKGFTIEDLNKLTSEWITISYEDPKTKEIKEKRELVYVKPYSQEYENAYRGFQQNLRILNREYYEAYALYQEKFGTDPQEEQAAKDALLEKQTQRDEHKRAMIKWMLENSNLPYVDSFYNLQLKLPEDIRDKLQEIYLEQEVILYSVGRGNEILLEESDFDRLKELDAEAKKLRMEAAERSPEYAAYLDELDTLYEFDTNDNYFRVMEKNARVRFSDSPEKLDKWYKDNTVTRPTSEWYDQLNELYDRRSEIVQSDPNIKELIDRKKKIMAPYKVAGRFNPKYLTDEEISELDFIEAEIEDIIEGKKSEKTTLTKDERKQVAEISAEIRKLVSFQLNPIYIEEFDTQFRILQTAFNEMNNSQSNLAVARTKGVAEEIEEAENNVIFAVRRFGEVENTFRKWYEKTHYNKYQSIATGYDIKANKVPKSFNFERLPSSTVADKYMETVPNPKYYKLKRLRIGNWTLDGRKLSNSEIEALQENPEEVNDLNISGRLTIERGAYNPAFIKGHDGIPLPKEIIVSDEGHFVIDPSKAPTSSINPKYLELLNNPQMFEFYNSMMDIYFDMQKRIEGRTIGYKVPGFAASLVESIANEGWGRGFSKQYNAFVDKHLKAEGQQDMSENIYGDIGARIRMRFSNQLDEDIQSSDAVGSFMKWTTEAHMNIAMQEVAPVSKGFIEFLKLKRKELAKDILKGAVYVTDEVTGERTTVDVKTKLAEMDNLLKIIEFENGKFLYGITESTQEASRTTKKIVDGFFKYTSFIRIGFDVVNQTKNYTSGNIQAFLAAGGNDSDHYGKKNWLFAKGKVYGYNGFLANYLKDWGRLSDLSESTMLYRIMNPAQKDIIKYFQNASGTRGRRVAEKLTSVGELGYMLQDKGDTEIAVTVMYAVMDNYRYEQIESIDPTTGEKIFKRDANGEVVMIPAHQAYYKDVNGNLAIRKDVNYTKEDEKRIRNIIYSEMRRAQGNYASADQTEFESRILGKMVFFFRKFLVPQFLNRFGYLRPNWEGSEMALGYWRAFARSMRMFGVGNTLKEFLVGSDTLSKMGLSGGVKTYVIKDPKTGKVIRSENVGDFYAKRVHHARRDAIAMALLTIISMMLLAFVKRRDDDDEELSMLEGNAIRVIWGTKGETVSMFPVGPGSQEYVKNFTTAIPFIREAQTTIRLLNHGIKYGMAMTMNGGEEPDPDYDSYAYQSIWKDAFYSRKSGAYEKGDAKIRKDIMDLTGFKNFRDMYDPNYRIDVLKRNQ
jgi:hypothetical protein